MALIEFQNVTKQYFTGVHILNALDNVSFSIEKGEFVVILGPSGAGKSTLLNLLGGMESATKGAILVDGKAITDMNAGTLTKYRATDVGFVFQFYNLIPTLTALENVELVQDICPGATPAAQALEQVGLLDHKYQFPSQLSGGEQQRVSIARAVSKNPKMLLCDEPTGALDYQTSKEILELMENVNRDYGCTVVIVTHNDAIKHMAHRVLRLRDGKLAEDTANVERMAAHDLTW